MINTFKNCPKFSFLLNGTPFSALSPTVTVRNNGDLVQTIYEFQGGLRLTNTMRIYPEYQACDWVNEWENTGDAPSDIISELRDCDVELPLLSCEEKNTGRAYLPTADHVVKVYAPMGSNWSANEFSCHVDWLRSNHYAYWLEKVGEKKRYATIGGRSSDSVCAPFFNIKHGKEKTGYIVAVGWTGQWNAEIERRESSVVFKSKIEDTHFQILPGEHFRTSSVTLMQYQGDARDGQNRWRRLIKDIYSPVKKDHAVDELPFCAGLWGGMSTDGCIERIRAVEKAKLPFNCYWMDAGWYGGGDQASPDEYEGDWALHTGNWEINSARHPDRMQDIVAEIAKTDKRFLLWFEPERVRRNVPIAEEHPEYLLFPEEENNQNTLLNLGNEQAWQYCFDTLSKLIRELKVSVYRQDFNFRPLPYWQKHDTPNRKGITEIKHINGLYRLWDALRADFPDLLIDNCSSGGRRIDIETLRRSVPLWRSDATCPADPDPSITQAHALSYGSWLPYSGTGTGRVLFDTYRFRSAYSPSLIASFTWSEKNPFGDDEKALDWINKMCREYLRVKPYLCEDVYPLTNPSDATDIWSAIQYHDPKTDSGVIQVFRRADSPYQTASFRLFGLSADRKYCFEDADGDDFCEGGAVLTENGLSVQIEERRKAKIYFYKAK